MSNDKKECLGKLLDYNHVTDIARIKFMYMTPDKLEMLETFLNDESVFKLTFQSLKSKISKTRKQLGEYFLNIKLILIASNVDPIAEHLYDMDDHFKKNVFELEFIEVGDSKIPHTKSKATMSYDEMDQMIKTQREMYDYLVDFETKEIRVK